MTLDDVDHVREQYADEGRLLTRTAAWHPAADGRDPWGLVLDAVRTALPAGRSLPDVLEVGCGTGAFAARLRQEIPGVALMAVDQSPRFVELTRERGVPGQVMDVQELLMGDDSYDVVLALWMLYHVPDLDRGLAEIRRVLRPGGTFVAVTNGEDHLADLRAEAGGRRTPIPFTGENGAGILARHFEEVRSTDLRTRAVFPDHAAAQAYLDSCGEGLEGRLPAFDGPREYAGHVTVFEAR